MSAKTLLPQINALAAFIDYAAGHPLLEGPTLTDIAICVPVRDEEVALPGLLQSFDLLERNADDRIDLCLLLDGCSDGSAAIAAAYQARSRHRVTIREIASACSNAGIARHQAMAMGMEAVGQGDALLLTTDGDSIPAADWLVAMKAASAQADIVTGRIVRIVATPSPLQDRIEAYYDRLFALRRRLDPVPWEADVTHHHTGGANIGIRAGAYAALGGFAPVAHGEDARLIDEAERAGMMVRRDATCVVRTSDRRDGRTGGGLAGMLRLLDASDASAVDVSHPDDAAWQYRMHAVARAAHRHDRLDRIAAAIGLSGDHVLGVARECPNAQAFAMRIVPVPPGGMRRTSLVEAEAVLRRLVDVRETA